MPSPGTPKNRVFFALWPDAAVQAQLARHGEELHERLGGKPTQQTAIHLTLVFLGEVNAVEQLHALAGEVEFEPFVLSIDRAGCWSHNKVAWLAPQTAPVPLKSLVAQLERLVARAGFEIEARPYSPHITVLRKAQCRRFDPAVAPVVWPVEDFVLLQSQLGSGGSRYSELGRWPSANLEATKRRHDQHT